MDQVEQDNYLFDIFLREAREWHEEKAKEKELIFWAREHLEVIARVMYALNTSFLSEKGPKIEPVDKFFERMIPESFKPKREAPKPKGPTPLERMYEKHLPKT